jgi:hypothetical protein
VASAQSGAPRDAAFAKLQQGGAFVTGASRARHVRSPIKIKRFGDYTEAHVDSF